jgi:peptidoglycan hydrolase CwlO-like protein
MGASEHERHELAAKLEELLGPDQAATLMEHLPPVRWDALARQDDLLALRGDVDGLRHDVDGLRHDVDGLRHDVDGFKGELHDLRNEMTRTNDRIAHLTEVMELRFESLGDRITAHVAERVDNQTKLLVFSLLAAVLTATAIALGSNAL